MFESMKMKLVAAGLALATLGTCTACSGIPQFTETQKPVAELYEAAETVDQKAWATIGIYYDTVETAKVECAKPAAPIETCAALEVAFDETAERVATASDLWASVIAYREIYGDFTSADAAGKAASAKAALDQALQDWVSLRPKVENAIRLGKDLPSE